MRIVLLITIFWVTSPAGIAQALNLIDFIPSGYSIRNTEMGNLNQDEYPDCLLILKSNLEDSLEDTPRPLIILHGQKGGRYVEIARNDNLVWCKTCSQPGWDETNPIITINEDFFIIEHNGYGVTDKVSFTYNKVRQDYVLYHVFSARFDMYDPDNVEIDADYTPPPGEIILFSDYR
jgi:hypothetical protein